MKILISIGLFITLGLEVNAQKFDLDGSKFEVNIKNEILEAGNDYIGTYASSADFHRLNVKKAQGKDWDVSIKYEIQNYWDASIDLQIRRTGSGNGPGIVSGGIAYQLVTPIENSFISGNGNKKDIPVQLQLSNISVTLPVADYKIRLIYTFTAM